MSPGLSEVVTLTIARGNPFHSRLKVRGAPDIDVLDVLRVCARHGHPTTEQEQGPSRGSRQIVSNCCLTHVLSVDAEGSRMQHDASDGSE